MSRKAKITVIGAGLMGHGIAQVFACAGHKVVVYDPAPKSLETLHNRVRENLKLLDLPENALSLISCCQTLHEAVQDADIVFEAVLEDLKLKQDLFAQIEVSIKPNTILASNTSVMPITAIMEKLLHRENALGTHWWNPPFLVPLVEVVPTKWTSPGVINTMMQLLSAVGKKAVYVKKDIPGFIGNRLQHALWREAVALVEGGICSAEDVDNVIKSSFGLRLAVLGPLENADLVGTDLTLAIHKTVLPAIDSRPSPSPYLEELVASGKLGMKTGEGFRRWTPDQQADLRNKVFLKLIDNLKKNT